MPTAAERAERLELISRLKTTFQEDPEWPRPDQVTSDHYWAYLKTAHDVGGELDHPAIYENKEEEHWELMTYVLCETLGWQGIWLSEERRRIAGTLHDGPVQDLVGTSFTVAGAEVPAPLVAV